jgi:ABC-type transport system involved in cytochrome c biogenesis permease subunit
MKFKLALIIALVLSSFMALPAFAADINTVMATLSDWWAKMPAWLTTITYVVTLASSITMMTPTNVDNKFVDGLLRVLNWLSLNIFKNKNADDVATKPKA